MCWYFSLDHGGDANRSSDGGYYSRVFGVTDLALDPTALPNRLPIVASWHMDAFPRIVRRNHGEKGVKIRVQICVRISLRVRMSEAVEMIRCD